MGEGFQGQHSGHLALTEPRYTRHRLVSVPNHSLADVALGADMNQTCSQETQVSQS